MNLTFINKIIATIMALSLSPQGAMAQEIPKALEPQTQFNEEWLSIEDMEERQSYDVDRSEVSKHLVETYTKMTGITANETGENPYDDVDADELPYVIKANALGLTIEDGKEFKPTLAVSRGELAALLYNMVEKAYPEAIAGDKTSIVFQEEVPQEYEKALSFAVSRGLIHKQKNNKVMPDTLLTLGELATALNRTVAAAPNFNPVNTNITEKRAYLTFDDAVSANTITILDTLKKYDIKATFFVTGHSDPVILKRIRDEGHTIGNHTMSHDYKDIYASSENFWQDFNAERDYLIEVLGDISMYMRFPGGSNNSIGVRNGTIEGIQAQAKEKGYLYVDWNVDSKDATKNTLDKDKIVNNVLNGAQNKTDAIILMHQTKPKTTTAEALPEIIEGLRAMGFEMYSLEKSVYYPQFMK